MTDAQIDVSQMPPQSWTIVVQPSLRSSAALSHVQNRPLPAKSPSASDIPTRHTQLPLEERLFDNAAELKKAYSEIVMHLAPRWREVIFRQLDAILAPESWEEDSAFIRRSSFWTFLRFLIYAGPTRLPSLGVGSTGHLLAAWINGNQRISAEFFPNDSAGATFVREGGRSTEMLAWRGHVADLKSFVERNGMIECLQGDPA